MKRVEVIEALEKGRQTLMEAVKGLGDEALVEPGVVDQWSIKDLLFHMTMWEAEEVKLLWQASQEQTPSTIHFSGMSMDEINAAWSAEGKDRELELVWEDFHGVRKQTLRRLSAFTDKDLEDIGRYPWLKEHPLWKWIAEDTFLHEEEHAEQIKKWRQGRGI